MCGNKIKAINSYEIDKLTVRSDTTKRKINSHIIDERRVTATNKKMNAQPQERSYKQVDGSHYGRKILISLNTHNRETTAYRDAIFIAHSHIQHGRQRQRLQAYDNGNAAAQAALSTREYANHILL